MSAETPKKTISQAEMRPQIAEDIFSTQSGEPASGLIGVPSYGDRSEPASAPRPESVSGGGHDGGDHTGEGPRGIDRMLKQMDRLRKQRKKLREAAVVSHAEMSHESEDYKEIQKKIIAIRKRLNEIAVHGETEEKKEEVQKLRDELARHFVAFRKALKERLVQEPSKEETVPVSEPQVPTDQQGEATPPNQEMPVFEGYERSETASKWQVKADEVDYDDETRKLFGLPPKEKKQQDEVWKVTPDTVSYDASTMDMLKGAAVPPEVVDENEVPTEYEKRLALRNEWKEKKHSFDTAYRQYVEQSAIDKTNRTLFERVQFWKKEKKPQALSHLEKEYQDARRAYAFSLHGAILDRIDERNPSKDTQRDKQVLQAALANRFIIKAANDRLKAEGEFIPHVEGKRTFQKLYQALQKNRKLITAAGYATVGGIALASGGVALAIGALAGKAIQTKITTAAIGGGLTAGSLVGNVLGDAYIKQKDNVRTDAMRNAAQGFSGRNLDRLEIEYLNAYRSYTKAVENKKVIVGTGAALGALGGALIAGNLEVPDALPNVADDQTYVAPENIPDDQGEEHQFNDDAEHVNEGITSILYNFDGGPINTVSEALLDTWKDNPAVLGEELTQSEFLAQMYGAIAEIEKDDGLRESLMTQMSISSGDIHEVLQGQTVDLHPFFEYMNSRL